MKKVLFLLAFAFSCQLSAQEYKNHYGVGLALGEPSGFSVKKFNSNTQAFQYTLGYSTASGAQGINLGMDYLMHNYHMITADKGSIPVYWGLGAHFKSYNGGNVLYARVPLGVAYEFNDLPADIFFEFAPGISVLPSPGLVTNFAIGGRFYFDFKQAAREIENAL